MTPPYEAAQSSMTPDERERLTRVEAKVETLGTMTEKMDEKLDKLLLAAAMGKGAWWAILKVGGLLSMVAAAGVWLWEQFGRPH